ncbi:glycosyltransferase [Methylobacterium sp. J-070]|uniref:glycosyltransferase n=1 Tax=Methylobacterium sp. J-070 TaxID=2836650 RepID=UPI001FBAE59A|nr:glycosyltransferase [Methylobacterium sp. J-070]MCJ2053795.1 glycosyltransferase [Methylobacterium sp. J-070]
MKLVITAMPMVGHLTPMLAIARIALARGDDVIVLTASHHADKVRGVGARFVPLPPSADMDLSRLEERFPERAALPLGPPRILFDFQRIFLDVMPAQAAVLREILDEERPDILVTDAFFFGATPIFLDRSRSRPPIVACGTTFLPLDRPDGAPTGPGLPPARDEADRARYVTIAQDVETHLNGPVRAYADALLAGLGLPALPCSLWQSRVMLAEAYLQPTAPSFEYDFGAPPNDIRFVGVLEACAAGTQQPDWWGDLDGTRRIVLVTQGTVANDDFSQLVEPTLAALADCEDLLVVVTTGGRPTASVRGPIPGNARIATFFDVPAVLSKADVLVTNGGYGTLSQALRTGVPVVAGGTTEDKSEVCARIAWSGVGLDLGTSTPDRNAIRTAVDRLLLEPSFRANARAIAADLVGIDAEREILATIDQVAARSWTEAAGILADAFDQPVGDERRQRGKVSAEPSGSSGSQTSAF